MRQLILCLFTLINSCLFVAAQDSIPAIKHDTIATTFLQDDSITKKQSLDQMSKNLDRMVADISTREKKAKRDAMIRIGIGVFFMAVLAFGLIRKRKQKSK
ncbi:MAG: hypothetical protein NVV59_02370 [Chitinophagaceae bacterium]|nr:hypothetical protein [Chitinophagaceae bacterium]